MKKILGLLAVLLALGAVAYFYFQSEKTYSDAAPLENAIPSQFPIALEAGNWESVFAKLDTLSYGDAFNAQDWYIGTKIHVQYLASLQNLLNLNEVQLGKSLVAYGNGGNSQLALFMAQELNTPNGLADFESALKANKLSYTEHIFESQKILTVNDFNGIDQASFTLYQGLFLCSFKPSFVEEAILSIDNNATDWTSLNTNIDNSEDVLLYVKPQELNYLAAYFLKTNAFDIVNSLDDLTGRTLVQVNFFENELSFGGYAINAQGTLLDTLESANPTDNYWLNMLPSNTAYHKMIGFDAPSFNQSDNLNVRSFLNELNGSITLYTLESFNETLSDRQGALLPILSEESMEIIQSLDSLFTVEKEVGAYTIHKTQLGELLNTSFLLNKYFQPEVYLVHLNDYIVLSSNLAVVEQYVNARDQNDLMQSFPANVDFKQSLSSKTNVDLFLNFDLMQPYLSSIATENTWQQTFSKINIQYSNIGDRTFCQGKARFKNDQSTVSKNLWATSLDTLANFKPQLVKNHNNDELEILVQDLSNQLYLLNTSGNVQWKIDISGKIQGDIYQIDYYNNRKLQYVFNTETKIYIVDRNGDNVDGFPIKLPSQSTNEMLVINYDNAGKYRYMVACDNGNVYGYEKNGAPLTGWNPLKNVGIIEHPIQHEVINGKDYIFFNNNEGAFYAFNRKGEERFPSVMTANTHNDFKLIDKVFVGGDFGSVAEIDLDGALKTKTILDESYQVFEPASSILEDTKAYAFAANKDFKFQLSQWKNFASYKTPSAIHRIESLVNNNNLWFLVYTDEAVFLIDEIGNLHPDFPVATKGPIRLVYLIEGKDRILLYCDTQGNLKAKEIKWTN